MLMAASQNGHLGIVEKIIDALQKKNMDVAEAVNHACDKGDKGLTAFHYAAQNGHLKVVKKLLAEGANSATMVSIRVITPLWSASQNGHSAVLDEILADHREKNVDVVGAVNHARDNGLTALHMAAQNGHLKVVKKLVDAGATVNVADPALGITPLFLATVHNHSDVVQYLLSKNANPDIETTEGNHFTARGIAKTQGSDNVVKVFQDFEMSKMTRLEDEQKSSESRRSDWSPGKFKPAPAVVASVQNPELIGLRH